MTNNIKIYAGYFVDRSIYTDEDIKQYLDNLSTYLPHIDKMYIYNQTKSDIKKFITSINAIQKIEYVDVDDDTLTIGVSKIGKEDSK